MQLSYVIFTVYMIVLLQRVSGIRYRNFLNEESIKNDSHFDPTINSMIFNDTLGLTSESSDHDYNTSAEIRTEVPANENSSQTDKTNSTSTVGDQSHSEENSTNSMPLSTHKVTSLSEIFGNESQSSSSYSSKSSSTGTGETISTHSVTIASATHGSSFISSESVDADNDEPEGVVRGKPLITENTNTTFLEKETLYQKMLALISDTYTLSILVPIAAGVIFATTIIVFIATCRCLNRRCRRRRLRRKALPDSVKNLRPSDQARLLAESSDEEF